MNLTADEYRAVRELSRAGLVRGPAPDPVLTITLPAARCTAPVISRLVDTLHRHPGPVAVRLHLLNHDHLITVEMVPDLGVTKTAILRDDLRALLGPLCV